MVGKSGFQKPGKKYNRYSLRNLAKSGKYYWVTTDFEINRDEDGNIISYLAFRRGATSKAIEAVEDLYRELLIIERKHGMPMSLLRLKQYLEEKGVTYDELMEQIVKPKSFIEKLFSLMKDKFYSSNNNCSNKYEEVA